MADSTLSALPVASALDGTELLYAVQGGASKKTTVDSIVTWVRSSIAAAALTVAAGTAGTPGLNFTGDTNTGFYSAGADQIGVAAGGANVMTIAAASVQMGNTTILSIGEGVFPGIVGLTDTDTGIGWGGGASNFLAFAAGGSSVLTVEPTRIIGLQPIQAADGSITAPGFSFSNDTNTGFYRIAADQLGVATGGTLRLTLTTSSLTCTLPYLGSAGSAAAPSLAFSGDSNTGFYSSAADEISISCGATQRAYFNTTTFYCTLNLQLVDKNIVIGTTTGTKFGTATTQKIGFFNSTPIVQPNSTGETVGFTAGAGTAVNDASTFTGNVGATAYRISDVVKHLKNLGLIAA